MSGVYTERLLQIEGVGQTRTLTVPENKRVILTNITMAKDQSAAPATIWFQVHGIWCWYASLPVTPSAVSLACKLVAYERETVVLQTGGADVGAHVSGYVFDDPVGAPPADKSYSPDDPDFVPGPAGEQLA
jgi:hypothetical protein